MKDLHHVSWYAKKIKNNIPNYIFKPAPERLLGGLAYLCVVSTGILAIWKTNNIFLIISISIILGFSFAALGFLGHEILHGSVVKTPWLKEFLGGVSFSPLSVGPRLWIIWHNMTHHAYTQDEEKDPDAWLSFEQYCKSSFLKAAYRLPKNLRSFISFASLGVFFSFHSFRMLLSCLKKYKKERLILVIELILPLTLWVGLLMFSGVYKWIFMYLIPLYIGNLIVMSYISTNHRLNPLTEVNDPLANSLSVTVPKWLDLLHFNFSYHVEHHLFSRVSSKYYPIIKDEILRQWPERYHQMPLSKALRLLWKTPRIYYNSIELIDPNSGNAYVSLGNGLSTSTLPHKTSNLSCKVNIN